MTVARHWDHWNTVLKLVAHQTPLVIRDRDIAGAFKIATQRDSAVRQMQLYNDWRIKDGHYQDSPATTKCSGGSAHGWEPITRVFIMEALLFDFIGRRRRTDMWKEYEFKRADIAELTAHGQEVLIQKSETISRWSARMVMLQLRALSQRFNHMANLTTNVALRIAIRKLLNQCRLRSYRLIEIGCRCPEVQKPASQKGDGLMSGKFTGCIVCTPQNNCGMSTISSSGSWLNNFSKSVARCITKISNVFAWVDVFAPVGGRCKVASEISPDIMGPDWSAKVRNFRRKAESIATHILDADQLQDQVIRSICPSIIGVDCTVRGDDADLAAGSQGIWDTSNRIAHTACSVWLDSYLRYQRGDYFLSSSLSKAFPDMEAACIAHAFEISSRRDGKNTFGFLETFFVRPEEAQNIRDTIIRDMASHTTPFIAKIGAQYVVAFAGRDFSIACRDMCEAIVTWAICFERAKKWTLKLNGINFESIYKPIIDEWTKSP